MSNHQEIALTVICLVSDDDNSRTDRDQAKVYAKDAITDAIESAKNRGFTTFLGPKSESMSMEINSILIDPVADIIHETAKDYETQERLRNPKKISADQHVLTLKSGDKAVCIWGRDGEGCGRVAMVIFPENSLLPHDYMIEISSQITQQINGEDTIFWRIHSTHTITNYNKNDEEMIPCILIENYDPRTHSIYYYGEHLGTVSREDLAQEAFDFVAKLNNNP